MLQWHGSTGRDGDFGWGIGLANSWARAMICEQALLIVAYRRIRYVNLATPHAVI